MNELRVIVLSAMLLSATYAIGHDHTKPQPTTTIVPVATQPNEETVPLSIQLIDDQSGANLPGCIRIGQKKSETTSDILTLPSLLPRGLGLRESKINLGYYVLPNGQGTVRVPRGNLVIEAISGLEYSKERVETNKAKVEIRLKRLFDPAKDNWVAGNTHLHLMKLTRQKADQYLTEVPRADGLQVVFVSYLERALADHQYISNRYTDADLDRLSTADLVFGSGEEYRHNIGGGGEGYGHVMFLEQAERILPASIGPGIAGDGTDGKPLRPGIDRAREGGGTIIWCHNGFGLEDLPNWLTGRVDAQNIFDGGNSGTYEDTFYRYLNSGIRVPFSTGTDWFIYDFSRVYVQLATGEKLSTATWLDALRKGRSIITNGPWLELQVDQATIGDAIDLEGPREVSVSARAIGRHSFRSLEIVANGQVVHSSPASRQSAETSFKLMIREPTWIAARINPDRRETNELGEKLFAHTSPIYLTVNGKGVYDPIAAESIKKELTESMKKITEQGSFANRAEREQVLEIYHDAMRRLVQEQGLIKPR